MSIETASRQRGRSWLLCACLLLGTPWGVRATEPAVVDSLAFVGLQTVDRALVDEALRLGVGEPALGFRITESVRNLYSLGLFDQVAADLEPSEAGGAILTFIFTERPRVTEVAFTGQDFFSIEDLKEHSGPEMGGVLRRSDLFKQRLAIEQAYRDEGYAEARVLPEAGLDGAGRGYQVRVLIEEGPRTQVAQVLFSGNEHFLPKELRKQMDLKKRNLWLFRKGRFQREKAEADIENLAAFYRNNGYKDVRVFLEDPLFLESGRGVDVTYRIEEGPRYYFGAAVIEGMSVFEREVLSAALLFVPGDPFDQSKVDESIAALYNIYTERGYLVDLRIAPQVQVRADTVAVGLMIREGEPSYVGEIRIVGNNRTKERVVRREVRLYPGDLLRRSKLLRSQREIFATGFFEDVQVEFHPSETEGEVDVTFRVAEKSSATANGGVGYSSQMGLTGFIKFGHNNLFGNGRALMLEVEKGKKRELYDISFTEPWMFGRHISMGIDVYNTENQRDVYAGDTYDASYWHRVRGAGIRIGFPWFFKIPDYTRLTLGYSLTETRYRDYESLPEETQAVLLNGEGTRSRVLISFFRNSTDNPFHPTSGARTSWRNELNGGWFGGDLDYHELTIDHRQYFAPLGHQPVVMVRARGGLMGTYRSGDRMPPAERFRLGGCTGFAALRGYDDYYLVPEENVYESESGYLTRFPGGKFMLIYTAEVQFPIVDPVHGIVFVDAGDTWNRAYDISLNGLKLGSGLGITLEVPMLGPIAFYRSYGFDTRKWKWEFAFGNL